MEVPQSRKAGLDYKTLRMAISSFCVNLSNLFVSRRILSNPNRKHIWRLALMGGLKSL